MAGESDGARARAAIKQMAPIMVMHPKEAEYCCFPSDPEKFFADEAVLMKRVLRQPYRTPLNGRPTFGTDQTYDQFVWNPKARRSRWEAVLPWGQSTVDVLKLRGALEPSIEGLPDTRYTYVTSGFSKNERPTTFSPSVPCFVQYWRGNPDVLQVKYWFWWKYNDHPRDSKADFGSHEGDWEHVELRLRWTSKTEFRFVYYLSAHGEGNTSVGTKWKSERPYANPYFFVSLGGHAIYEKPGEYKANPGAWSLLIVPALGAAAGYGQDSAQCSDNVWHTGEHLKFWWDLDEKHPIRAFKGLWGHSANSPTGPAAKDRWQNAGPSDFP